LPPRLAFIQRRGRLYPLPAASVLGIPTRVAPFLATGLFSWPGKIRMGLEALMQPPTEPRADESIGDFMRRHFGREATEFLAEPLLAGIHAGDVDRLSIAALFPRFTEAERTDGSLLRAFRRQPTAASPDGAFRSLPGGLSELVNALVAALPPDAISLGTAVDRVVTLPPPVPDAPSPLAVITAGGERVDASAVIVSVPAYGASRLLREVDADAAALCGGIAYASTATVAMAFPREMIAHPLNGSGFVVPRSERTGILAASWLSSKWAHRAPEGRALLRVFIGGARDPHALERPDQELVTQGLAAIRPLLGIRRGDPLFTRTYRWGRGSAPHEVGHLGRIRRRDQLLARRPGLFVTGSGFRGVGIPDCIADARATAARAAAQLT
jgi:oxygen-dependent protoporphyrinogen oxidase